MRLLWNIYYDIDDFLCIDRTMIVCTYKRPWTSRFHLVEFNAICDFFLSTFELGTFEKKRIFYYMRRLQRVQKFCASQ